MPRVVNKIPNPWEPYMDGKIWEFDDEEFRRMPGYNPMTNRDAIVIGMRMVVWHVIDKMYVRFVDADDTRSPEELAGWV